MNIEQIILVLFLHWIGDFVLQTKHMAENKSSDNKVLGFHVLTYCLPLLLINPYYSLVNGILHACVDYFTSRLTKKFYSQNKMRYFWIVIGFDQFLHTISLILTLKAFHYFNIL